MKLLELRIHNIRGILDVELKPRGHNLVLWGPNGAGKSAVVDAIDFLLTGKMSRLMGKGAGKLSLAKHGTHVDSTPDNATVHAVIQIRGINHPVKLQRCIGTPTTLECDELVRPLLEPILQLARRGQHVLTRREILKYITADGSTRAEEVQSLLNLSEVENVRKSLVKVHNDFAKDLQAGQRNLTTTKGHVNATLQLPAFDKDAVLISANRSRAVLAADAILQVKASDLKKGILLPRPVVGKNSISATLLVTDLDNLRAAVREANRVENAHHDSRLRVLVSNVQADARLLKSFSQHQLLLSGKQLIEDSGECPLCDTPWEPGKLAVYVDEKLRQAKTAAAYVEEINNAATALYERVAVTLSSLQKVVAALKTADAVDDRSSLLSWLSNLQVLSKALIAPVDNYLAAGLEANKVASLMAPLDVLEVCDRTAKWVTARFPKATPEQTAWDLLTRLEENLKAVEAAQLDLDAIELSHKRAQLLLSNFNTARDFVLNTLYSEIRERFVGYYRKLHGPDEDDFDARIQAEGPAVDIEVSFHGRGKHPPHALHSEGHQDSMGICLYLALADQLTSGLIDLIVLDDVVMSVDAGHRRQLASLVAEAFPNRQFLITTHDKTWASQLRSGGVVNTKGSIELFNWTIGAGPHLNTSTEIWARIEADVTGGDMPAAAARLRHGCEGFFSDVCDAIQAPVRFRLDARWELGDLLWAAVGEYKDLIKKAKNAAQSWGRDDEFGQFVELDSVVKQVFARSQAEYWAVNANVHYNNWANFSPADFRPVVEAFRDLFSVFTCSNCGTLLRAASNGANVVSLRCDCGTVNYNLIKKPREIE